MNRTFINTYKVSMAQQVNILIYYLKKLPLVGKKIPDKLYGGTKNKEVLTWIWIVLAFLFSFVRKAIYLGLIIFLPAKFLAWDGEMERVIIYIFFILSFVLGPVINVNVMDSPEKAFTMIRLMKVDPKEYYLNKIFHDNIKDFISFLPAIMFVFTPMKGFILIVEFITLRFIFEAIHLSIFKKTNKIIVTNMWFNVIFTAILLIVAYLPPYLNMQLNMGQVLYNPVVVILLATLGILGGMYLSKYDYYKEINKFTTQKSSDSMEVVENIDINFYDVQINEKKIKSEDLRSNKFEKKQGYEYLNAIFFERHKNLLIKPVIMHVVVILLIFILTVIFTVVMPERKMEVITVLKKTSSVWVMIMYFVSSSERICKAMFYNCDVSLLRYGYYREGKVILSGFRARIKRIVAINLIPAIVICMAIISLIFMVGGGNEILTFIPMLFSIICLSAFFSIHNIFLYYMLQPYTSEMKVKSPLFKFVNTLVYVISYICLKLDGASYLFSLGVVVVTVVYMMVALVSTYKLAPKTFKLK